MTREQLDRVEQVCHEALARAPEQRARWLDEVCGDDPAVRGEVEALLAELPAAEAWLRTPPPGRPPATAVAHAPPPLVGRTLGGYRVEAAIGAGGMGQVFRAVHCELGRPVALKILSPEFATDPERLARFRREARILARLNHPAILTIHDVGADAGLPFVVTELLEGETVREVMAHRHLSPRQVLPLALQAAQGLATAHSKGIVHRDIKPENLFLTTEGRLKLLDFGLAKRTPAAASLAGDEEEASSTQSGLLLGTVAYMSPEQVNGRPVDARADVFAFGVVLYEWLTRRHPFRRNTLAATLDAILHDTPLPPVAIAGDLPPAVSGIVQRCLAKSRDDRYADAGDLAAALAAVVDAPSGAASLRRVEERSPYPGLRSFTERDAHVFVGREAEVAALWDRLRMYRLHAVIGPSGAGKTSFVRAGLVPARPDGWAAIVCTPGPSPLRALGQALATEVASTPGALARLVEFDDPDVACRLFRDWRRAHDAALVVVDQFEELFTLNPPEVQARFADLLGRLVEHADVHVVLSLRDDFLIRCCQQPPLAPVLGHLTALLPLSRDALRRALVEPAAALGYRFEPAGLADEMVTAVEETRSPLPLLAFAVARLWERRDRERACLTREAYREIGGVEGALAQHAEETLQRVGIEHEPAVREFFRNLVTAQGTRAVIDWDELLSVVPDRGRGESILRELVSARLLTSYEVAGSGGRPGHHRVELAHESLLTAWPRLVRWRTQDEESAQLRDQLKQAAHLWDEKGRSADLLWTGMAFREFALWRDRHGAPLTSVEEAFAAAMTDQARRRRRLAAFAIAAAFLVLAASAVAIALSRRQAVEEARRAEASRLVALGRLELDRYPTAAIAYARKSLEVTDTIEARLLALAALARGPAARIVTVPNTMGSRVAFGPGGRWLAATGFDSRIDLVSSDGTTRRLAGDLPSMADPRGVAFDPGGQRLFTFVVRDEWTRVFDLDGRLLESLPLEAEQLAVVDEGRLLAVGPLRGDPRQRVVWLTEPGGQAPREIGRWSPTWDIGTDHLGTRVPTAVDRTGRWLAYARGHDVFVHDLRTSSRTKEAIDRLVGSHDQQVRSLTWHQDGDRLASIDEGGGINLWQASTARLLRQTRGPAPHRYTILAFDASGGRLTWSSGAARATCLWEVGSLGAIGPSCFGSDTENGVTPAIDPSGTWLAAADGGRVTLWPVAAPYARTVPSHAEGPVKYLAFASDSSVLASCARDGLRLTPLSTHGQSQARVTLPGAYFCYGVSPFPSGTDFAVTAPLIGVYRVSSDGARTQLLMPYPDQKIALGTAAVDTAGRRVAVATQYAEDANLMRAYVMDLVTGAQQSLPLRDAESHDPFAGAVRGVAFTHDGHLLTAGDGGVRRWDLSSGRAVRLAGEPGSYATLAGDRDGRHVVAVLGRHAASGVQLEGSELRVFDPIAGVAQTIRTHGNRLTLAFATDPGGRIVVTGDAAGVVRVGRVDNDPPHLLLGHSGEIDAVAVSPDGKWIASSSGSEIRLWPMPDLASTPFHTLPHDALMARLDALTNLRVVEDPASSTGYRLEIGPFPGWKDVPIW